MKETALLERPAVQVDIGGGAMTADAWSFGLSAPGLALFTRGVERRLTPGPARTLARRTRDFFGDMTDRAGGRGPALLVGALPFDRQADDFLFLPAAASNRPWAGSASRLPISYRVQAEPVRAAYEAAVARALGRICAADGENAALEKVVLSRAVRLEADQDIEAVDLWRRLAADSGAVRFITPVGLNAAGRMRHLVGATPELLVSKAGDHVASHPLAGSARRGADLSADEAIAQRLTRSDKDRREHALVVEAILDALSPLCRDLRAPEGPSLISTRTMWHLGTRIEGRLSRPDEVSSAELAALLHPTPAVAGAPREAATALIRELEPVDRGFYAGAVGWTNAAGDGAWHVSLRCAEVDGPRVRLYAGAGVVEGSDPAAEAAETSAKFEAMLRAIGVDETGCPMGRSD